MLLRAYRITDKVGLILLKSFAWVSEILMGVVGLVLKTARGGVGGVITLLLMLFSLLVNAILSLVKTIGRVLRWFGRGLWRLISLVLGAIGSLFRGTARVSAGAARVATQRVATTTSDTMARRAARAQIDVKIAEDPLKVQNRRLSVAVLVMGFLVVGAVLWATDPSRTVTVAPIVGNNDNPASLLASNQATTIPPTAENVGLGLPTPIPVATQVPLALRGGGTLAYTVRESGQTDLWLVGVGSRTAIRITNDISDERDPSWNRAGTQLAYASHRDGNWELYLYDLSLQESQRLTYDLSFQANPKFSPDGLYLAYESYQGENLDIYAVPIDGSAPATRITDNESTDFSPIWSADGRKIAFVSWREGNQDIYIFNLDTLETSNLTQTPLRDEDHPAWSPDNNWLAYSAFDNGSEKVFVQATTGGDAQVINFGRTPSWSPDGSSLTFAVDSVDGKETYLYAVPYNREGAVATEVIDVPYGSTKPTWSEQTIPPALLNSGGLPLGVTTALFVEQSERSNSGAPFRLSTLLDVQAPRAVLSDLVNDSFNAFRARVVAETDTDFLANLDDAFWDLERLPNPGEARRSWHMTGRGIAFSRNALLGFPPSIEVIREEIGVNTYWRIFLRVDEDAQAGQLGEPLRRMPWDFLSATQGDVEAYNQGGRLRASMPSGYYVDLTLIAQDYGWQRLPSGSDWRGNTATRNFWMFINAESDDWCTAMLEIYTEGEMVNFCPRGS
jgi:hypothetical protein